MDFVDSINLVWCLATKSPSCREALRSAMFPSGVMIADPILLETASILGWIPQNVAKLNSNVPEIAIALRKQVEILGATDEPSKLGGFGHISKPQGDHKMVVHVSGMQQWVDAMAALRESLTDSSVRQLIEAVLDMIVDDRNIIKNRVSLVHSLEKFTSHLPTDLSRRASELLGRIARGDFKESEVGQTHRDATNPLNACKMNFGDPRSLRGAALLALSAGSKAQPAWSKELHSGILQNFLEVDDEELRESGVLAACGADRLSETETAALIASSLDGSPEIRKHVLHGISAVDTIVFDRQSVRLAIRAISRGSDSTDAGERAGAAKAAAALLDQVEVNQEMRKRLMTVLECLRTDVSHFVRKCASTSGVIDSTRTRKPMAQSLRRRSKGKKASENKPRARRK